MSFILDALKKLEQKRREGSVPDLTTVHLGPSVEQKKRSILPYLFAIAILINAGILAALLLPGKQEKQENAINTASINQEPAVIEPEQKAPEPIVQPSTPAPVKETVPVKEATVQAPPVPDTSTTEHVVISINKIPEKKEPTAEPDKQQAVSEKPVSEEAAASLSLEPSAEELENLKSMIKEEHSLIDDIPAPTASPEEKEETAETDSETKILEIAQLPEDIKKDLPKITIKGHIYSNRPSSRIVNINGIITREGDTVTSELRVEEITMTGIIFNYEGFRFRMRAF